MQAKGQMLQICLKEMKRANEKYIQKIKDAGMEGNTQLNFDQNNLILVNKEDEQRIRAELEQLQLQIKGHEATKDKLMSEFMPLQA